MGAAQYDFEIPQGGTVDFVVDLVGGPADVTGYTGKMMIRELRSDILPLATINPADITVNGGTRQVHVRIPSSETAGYDWERGVYDLYIVGPGADEWRVVEGRVTNSFAVTRS